eukprot:TRINITY_DN62671_c0_g1_i1.p1 TRINITY_DN62671_c0_g1~~TRINITY_DN62671_c0_g1_i1.p1  ORF type:complete len:221 (+),score=27.94 TRINITY_DN62671_c0_g1_i1:88-750(+)
MTVSTSGSARGISLPAVFPRRRFSRRSMGLVPLPPSPCAVFRQKQSEEARSLSEIRAVNPGDKHQKQSEDVRSLSEIQAANLRDKENVKVDSEIRAANLRDKDHVKVVADGDVPEFETSNDEAAVALAPCSQTLHLPTLLPKQFQPGSLAGNPGKDRRVSFDMEHSVEYFDDAIVLDASSESEKLIFCPRPPELPRKGWQRAPFKRHLQPSGFHSLVPSA